jgi:hypothetical protein
MNKYNKISGRACKPDSVRRAAVTPLGTVVTLRTRRGDHSSRSRIALGLKQPTRGSQGLALSSGAHTGWASPPLLFGLAPRGVFRAPDVTIQAVGSYPTFSPLPKCARPRQGELRFSGAPLSRNKRLWRYIFCGTIRRRVLKVCFRPPLSATPWRYQARCPFVAGSCEFATNGVRTFLPSAHYLRSGPAITRLTRHSAVYAATASATIVLPCDL